MSLLTTAIYIPAYRLKLILHVSADTRVITTSASAMSTTSTNTSWTWFCTILFSTIMSNGISATSWEWRHESEQCQEHCSDSHENDFSKIMNVLIGMWNWLYVRNWLRFTCSLLYQAWGIANYMHGCRQREPPFQFRTIFIKICEFSHEWCLLQYMQQYPVHLSTKNFTFEGGWKHTEFNLK